MGPFCNECLAGVDHTHAGGLHVPAQGEPLPARPPRDFEVGHRVIVLENNGFDDGGQDISPHFGPMAGHYGAVVKISRCEDYPTCICEPLIGVRIEGRVGGPVSPRVDSTLWGQDDRTWYFYPRELEHTD